MNPTTENPIKSLIIVYSYHHNNTRKVAQALSDVLNAEIKNVDQVNIHELHQYDLIGFGAGIDSAHHYQPLLDLVATLPSVQNTPSFIFSTSAVMGDKKVRKDHQALRDLLVNKGYDVFDEFACKGFNTNSFLKYIGGMNKGRPNLDDLNNAKNFAVSLLKHKKLNVQ